MICAHCGTKLPEDALFCGECGRSLAKAKAAAPIAQATPAPPAAKKVVDPPVKKTAAKAPRAKAPTASTQTLEPPVAAVQGGGDTRVIKLFDEPDGISVEELTSPPVILWSPPRRLLSGRAAGDPSEDLEETRLVTNTKGGTRFVLQFSTGESVTTFGTGLIGRNPNAEPGEYFDQLIAIVDPGKSVSKTHLEFGQISGAFWISDRYSGNGTVVREPDSQPRRCEPGRRYRVVRGTRVSIGEQFFVVS